MQTAFTQKMVVPTKAAGLAKPSRTSRHVVMAVNGAERNEASAPLKAIAVAGLAALLVGTESPAFGQGELLEQLVAQQKAGAVKAKTIKAASKPAEVPVYGKNKPNSAPKPAASKPASKPAPKKAVAEKKVATKALKFDSKAGSGTQGAAPAGVELPVPKGATKAAQAPKPVAAKKAAARPVAAKAAPAPKAAAPKAAAKPAAVTAVKKEAPAAAPKAAAKANPLAAKKAATAAAATATAAKVVTSSAPAFKAAASSTPAAASGSNDGTIQAGAVLAAELAGLAIASSIVGQITRPSKA